MEHPHYRFHPAVRIPFLTILFALVSFTVLAADGGAVFKGNCASCHTLTDAKLTGPGLAGVSKRVPSKEWMIKWVTNNKKMISSGDAYAVKVYGENKADMTVFDGVLSQEDIKAVVEYIFNPPAQIPITTGPTGGTGAGSQQEGGIPVQTLLIYLSAILVVLLFILRGVSRHLQNTIRAKKGLEPLAEMTFSEGILSWVGTHKRKFALLMIVVTVLLAKAGWDALYGIGVYQGYKPSQPIKFSHKIHAGDNQINCVYCHSGVLKGKTAGIPTANVCMNCHRGIQQGTITGKEEIAKIYAAIGWDPAKAQYGKPGRPLMWNRVHNLPDFVYFSHAQHVVVGKQECKTCHGEVEKMDVAQQFAPLTMGWCIDCHRKTEVPGMSTNPYYEEMHKKLAEKYKGSKDQAITVAKMGGLDCAKCHY